MKTIEELIIKRKQLNKEVSELSKAITEIQSSCEHEFEIVYSAMLYDIAECKKCKFERDLF